MRAGTGIGLAGIAVIVVSAGSAGAQTTSVSVQATGQPPASVVSRVRSGIKITLQARKESYFMGENILLDYKIANDGDGQLDVDFSLNCGVVATDEAGRRVAESGIPWHCHGGTSMRIPRGEYCIYTVPLMRHCNFGKPGIYRIRVAHDLGWRKAGGERQAGKDIHPNDLRWAETTITLVMPDAKQARQVVAAMCNLPSVKPDYDTNQLLGGGSWGRPGYRDFPDYTCLRYPIYLPILMERAGDEAAWEGIAHIPTSEATAALVAIMKHLPPFALPVAGMLNNRLPDPAIKREGRKNPYQDQNADLAQVRGLWDPKLAPEVREYARNILLGRDGAMSDQCGSFILEAIGTGEDMPAVVAVLDAVAGEVKMAIEDFLFDARPGTPRQVRMDLVYAGQALVRAGATPPLEPRTPGQIIHCALSLRERADFRPQGWETLCAGWLGHEVPFVREQVLRNVPRPLPEQVKALLPALLTDRDEYVLVAALEAVRDGGGTQCRDNVARLIATTAESLVLESTPAAAHAAGIARDEYLLMLVERLDPSMLQMSLYQLFHILNEGRWKHHGPACIGLPSKEQVAIAQHAWRRFIKENAEAIRRGKHFGPTDPEIVPGMFFAGMDCVLDDRQREAVRNPELPAAGATPTPQPPHGDSR